MAQDARSVETPEVDQERVHKALARMIIIDEHPFSFVEHSAFVEFMESLAGPGFQIPSAEVISRDCAQLFKDENYEGEEIGRAVEKCLHDWEINDVMTISAGNANLDIDAALTYYLRGKLPNSVLDGKFLRLGCIVDFINTLVKDLLNEHDELIERVRGAVGFVGLSEDRIKMFKEPEFKNDTEDVGGVLVLDDWQTVRKLLTFLNSFHELYEHIYGLNVTSNDFFVQITTIDCLLHEWEKSDDTGTRIIALKMRESFTKYWGNYEDINMLVYVADVLDPRHKLAYIKHYFQQKSNGGDEDSPTGDCLLKKMVESVHSTTFDLFNEYKGMVGTQTETLKSNDYMIRNSVVRGFQEWVKTCNPGKGDKVESESELEKYLDEYHQRMVDGFDILLSWKISTRFRILTKMAKDVLAIPMSAVAPESAFTIGGKFLDDFRSSLSPEIVEALVCAQDWIRKSRKPLESEEDLLKLDDYLIDIDATEDSSGESEMEDSSSGSEVVDDVYAEIMGDSVREFDVCDLRKGNLGGSLGNTLPEIPPGFILTPVFLVKERYGNKNGTYTALVHVTYHDMISINLSEQVMKILRPVLIDVFRERPWLRKHGRFIDIGYPGVCVFLNFLPQEVDGRRE
uniref:zinc finger BED domain-containing protein RICESLEEPER 3-like n=1 Tax=Erigeron canadensis TaxID=72917 RepID=UPI001CB945D5|nr:zinc finger BED domain-containing protein RICESLEEPER 3-like [Erigeron canadensis]